MINLFKKKPLKLECYTYLDYASRHFPLEIAKKAIPETFSSMPAQIKAPANYTSCPYTKLIHGRKMNTIKSCDGILDLWGKSYVLSSPFDVAINIKNDKVEYATPNDTLFKIGQHPQEQFAPMFPGYANVKIIIPWKFVASDKFTCMFSPAIYHMDNDVRENIILPPGLVDYKYVHSTNINMLVKLQKDQKVIHIKAGTPLIYITPLTTEPVELVIKTVDQMSWEGLENQMVGFKSIYKWLKRRDKNK